jgi:serine hydrolase
MVVRVFAGDDDPFVPVAISEDLAANLDVQLELIPQGGHINRGAGFTQLVVVASAIQESDGTIARSLETQNGQGDLVALDAVQANPAGAVAETKADVSGLIKIPVKPGAENVPKQEGPVKKLAGLETMYEDMSHLVNSNKGVVASSLLKKARQDEQVAKSASPASPMNMAYIIGTIIVILVAFGIFGLVLQRDASVALVASSQSAPVPSLISADTHFSIPTNTPAYTLAAAIRSELTQPGSDGNVLDIDYLNAGVRPSFADVLSALGVTTLPDSLASVLPKSAGAQPVFMHGQAFLGVIPAPFLVIPVTDYDTAFSGFRDWEPSMFRDTGVFMNVPDAFLRQYLSTDSFDDELIDNHQVRVLRYTAPPTDDSGVQAVASPYNDNDVMLAYFFLNDHAVIVVNNLDVIPTILERYDDRQVYTQK